MALIGWWRLDGDLNDYSGYGNHGTVSGSGSWEPGKIGQARLFTADNSQITIPHSELLSRKVFGASTTFSFSLWAYLTAWENYGTLIQKATGASWSNTTAGIWTHTGGIRFLIGSNVGGNPSGSSVYVNHAPSLNEWHHIVGVADGTRLYLYVDGDLKGTASIASVTHPRSENTAPIVIGPRNNGGTSKLRGMVQDVRVYDHALSLKEIKELGRAKVLHYKFDDFQEPTENLHSNENGRPTTMAAHGTTPPSVELVEYGHAWGREAWKVVFPAGATPGFSDCRATSNSWIMQRDGTKYTQSVYIKGDTSDLHIYHTGSVGLGRMSPVEEGPNGFIRYAATGYRDGSGTATEYLAIFPTSSPSHDIEIYVVASQVEAKSHPTPFTSGPRTGRVIDSSGYGNHATLELNTTPRWTSDSKIGGGAYEFDGTQFITLPSHFSVDAEKDATYSAWVYLDSSFASDGNIIGGRRSDHNSFKITSARRLQGRQDDEAITSSSTIPLNTWTHVAYSFEYNPDGACYQRLYINGQLDSSRSISNYTDAYVGRQMWIGWESRFEEFFVGKIDDVRIYATVLSDSDIKELYQQRASIDHRGNVHVTEIMETGYRPSLIDYRTWQIGATSAPGFNRNGSAHENLIIEGADPWGNKTAIWEAIPDGSNNADGGWNTPMFSIDNTKTYRFSVWVNRTVMGSNGSFYLGCYGYGSVNGVVTRSGSVSTNPYFYTGRGLPEGEWVLVVGHVHPYHLSETPIHPDSGVWRLDGTKYADIGEDFRWLPETVEATHRSYLYYTTDTSVRQRWCYPRVDVCDGTEPTLADLLSGRPDVYSHRDAPFSVGDSFTHTTVISEAGVTAGLAAWYSLDGHANDISGNRRSGNVYGAVPAPAFNGKMGYEFDGTDDYIDLQYGAGLNPAQIPHTFSLWLRADNVSVNSMPMSSGQTGGKNNRFYLGIYGGRWAMGIQNTSWSSSGPSAEAGKWTHLACVMDGKQATLYVNAQPAQSISYTGYAFNRNIYLAIHDNEYQFDGVITDVRIYNRALSPKEVQILYDATKESALLMQQAKSGVFIAGQLIEV